MEIISVMIFSMTSGGQGRSSMLTYGQCHIFFVDGFDGVEAQLEGTLHARIATQYRDTQPTDSLALHGDRAVCELAVTGQRER